MESNTLISSLGKLIARSKSMMRAFKEKAAYMKESLTRRIFSPIQTHMRGSSRVFVLTIFSLTILSFLLPINFIFHDVVDKFPVHALK